MNRVAHTTEMLFDNGDYFIANLDDGGIRLGMRDMASINFPNDHAKYEVVKTLAVSADAEAIEEAFDEAYIKYSPLRTDGYAHIR